MVLIEPIHNYQYYFGGFLIRIIYCRGAQNPILFVKSPAICARPTTSQNLTSGRNCGCPCLSRANAKVARDPGILLPIDSMI